jgi:hypothetical protein
MSAVLHKPSRPENGCHPDRAGWNDVMEPFASERAKAMADGLIRTGRAWDCRAIRGHLELRAKRGGFYWITADGQHLLQRDDLESALELQPNFAQAMVRLGGYK